ncbi:MAG: sigma-70 family RNA polymerase sigma factor, partial [Bacteroidota bacterium]
MNHAQAQAIRQLLSDAREEQKEGIEFLYRVERPKIFNKFANYCDPAELEELFDDALIVLLKRISFVEGNPITYFWQICRNQIYDLHRAKQKKGLVLTEEEELIQLRDHSVGLKAPDFEFDGQQAYQYAIQRLMSELGVEEQKVLMRRYFQDWSNQDIAEEEKI